MLFQQVPYVDFAQYRFILLLRIMKVLLGNKAVQLNRRLSLDRRNRYNLLAAA